MPGWISAPMKWVDVEFDLESSPLQLRTKHTPEKIKVYFYNSKGHDAGAVFIDCTSSTPKYKLQWCTEDIRMTETLPTTIDRTWQIAKSRELLMITIQCNEIVVANKSLSDDTCTKKDWMGSWSRDVETIRFDKYPEYGSDDTDFYRAGTA